MATPEEFAQRMHLLGVKLTGNVDALVRKVALRAEQAVVLATPVDTGRARSNWIASVDAPSGEQIDAHVPGTKGSTQGPNAQEAIDRARAEIAKYNGDRNKTINLTNNLPYIQRLDEGWSAQAPAGFVRIAVAQAVAATRGARLLD